MGLLQKIVQCHKIFKAPMAVFGAVFGLLWASHAAAEIQLQLETGAAWQERNDVQIPGDEGTRFELDEVLGDDPQRHFRFTFNYTFEGRHGLRLVYAPLRIEESGRLPQAVDFVDHRFDAGEVEARYKFDSHRATYRYRVWEGPQWHLDAGVTALIRDAEIRLQQYGESERDTDQGLVPLLHLAGAYQLTDALQLSFDFDGLAAAQGRAVDLGVRAELALDEQWSGFIGYRLLEGGVDNDDVYNFALFNYATIGVNYRY